MNLISVTNEDFILLGLNDSEKKIVLSLLKMGKTSSMLSRHTKIPRTTIINILKKLEKRSMLRTSKYLNRKIWVLDIQKHVRLVARIQMRSLPL